MRPYRAYTDEQVIQYAKEVDSMSGLLTKLGLKPAGGNYIHMKSVLQRLNISGDHWEKSSWNRGERLKDWKNYTKITSLKKHLIVLRGRCCERCKNNTWLDQPISIEIHHIDGDRSNNEISNLKLLCPNCHSYTDNYCGRKKVKAIKPVKLKKERKKVSRIKLPVVNCLMCSTPFNRRTSKIKFCSRACYGKYTCRNIPTKEQLLDLIKIHRSFSQIGKVCNVSDNTIKDWCAKHDLLLFKEDLKNQPLTPDLTSDV